jgi:hypothetical protein
MNDQFFLRLIDIVKVSYSMAIDSRCKIFVTMKDDHW